jgi:hypothetical protein
LSTLDGIHSIVVTPGGAPPTGLLAIVAMYLFSPAGSQINARIREEQTS